jgi:hypothetical protein
VPRAEWLLVKALDALGRSGRLSPLVQRMDLDHYRKLATTDRGKGSDASAALRGLRGQCGDEGNPDAYNAGHGLAIALESS